MPQLPPLNPLVMIGAGLGCLLLAITIFFKQRRVLELVGSSKVEVEMPIRWDDGVITKALQRHQHEPAVLSHLVESIKTRMVVNQDLKTAQRRLELMRSVIELFTLGKDLQAILYDINLAEKDFEIRKIETEIRHDDAESRLASERRLRELRAQRDELQIKKEITQLEQDIKTVEHPPGQDTKSSKDDERRRRREEIELNIERLKTEKASVMASAKSEEDRRWKENMLDDRLRELEEQRLRYL
jgi:hypothetical protein